MESLIDGDSAAAAADAAMAPTSIPSSRLSRLVESLKLEQKFQRMRFECLKKSTRANYRIIEKEKSTVICSVAASADRVQRRSGSAPHFSCFQITRTSKGETRKFTFTLLSPSGPSIMIIDNTVI
uniref:Uncharacterized protein n=1 Tax=Nelumbo nucifera TaxID=4432 RepID=A0A822Y441_NELNU|nr:TPA_asm: hypothetical protein HUJ06_027454 [Nelumbo nucifera]